MFPARFDYAAPGSLEEALSLLSERGDEAKLLAGGQSLIPLMKLRFAVPELLVDIGRIAELDYIREDEGGLRIGPLARHNALAANEIVKERYPAMAAAAPQISDPIVRNLGTLAGSLAHADPAGDWGSVMLAHRASVVARSGSGERTIPISEFFQGPFTSALQPDEILTEVRVPRPEGRHGGAYIKLERKVGDFATVATAVTLDMSNGSIGRAGIALTAVGPQNIHATAAEEALAGAEPGADAFDQAARLAAEATDPQSDVRGSADYKREAARVFVRRALDQAYDMAGSA